MERKAAQQNKNTSEELKQSLPIPMHRLLLKVYARTILVTALFHILIEHESTCPFRVKAKLAMPQL